MYLAKIICPRDESGCSVEVAVDNSKQETKAYRKLQY